MSVARIMYMTEDADQSAIPATGYVLLPYNKPNADKPLNTIVWTHGTAGRIRNCAPSNHKDLYYEWQGPYALAHAGYAVFAPDYSGQGSDIPQGFMYEAGLLHVADATYGLIAARKALGDLLSEEYVVVGHSEGGLTSWRTNERLAMPNQDSLLKAGKYLGSVSNAPALRPLLLMTESIRRAGTGPLGDAVTILLLQSIAALFPDTFRLEDFLTETTLARIPLVDQGCLVVARTLFAPLTVKELFKNLDWLHHPDFLAWDKTYHGGTGPYPLAGPMLVVQGLTDPLVYPEHVEAEFNRTCNAFPDTQATLLRYPDTDHNVVVQNTQLDYLAWIRDRFDHKELPKGCHIETVKPITNTFRDVITFYAGVDV